LTSAAEDSERTAAITSENDHTADAAFWKGDLDNLGLPKPLLSDRRSGGEAAVKQDKKGNSSAGWSAERNEILGKTSADLSLIEHRTPPRLLQTQISTTGMFRHRRGFSPTSGKEEV